MLPSRSHTTELTLAHLPERKQMRLGVCWCWCATPTARELLRLRVIDDNVVSSAYFDSHDHHWRAIVKLIRNNNTAISIELHNRGEFTNTCAHSLFLCVFI